ncbi:22277_t:CDS:1, partial [Gigaspora rosea]
YLEYFGKAHFMEEQPNFTTRAIYIRIITKIEKREASLREHWSIVLSQKKTYMVTPGRFDIAELEKRNNYRGIICNIPTRATESLPLRQLRKYKVQAIQILNNSNGNKARRAYIYFSSEQDKKAAQDTSVYYFDTKLFWNDYAERRREKPFYNYHQHQHETKNKE